MIWKPKDRDESIALPSYESHASWGIRSLKHTEIFDIWGWSKLCNSNITLDNLLPLTPTQPLVLVANSHLKHFSSSTNNNVTMKRNSPLQKPTCTTTFRSIVVTISHDWINYTPTKDNSDSAPIPSIL